MTIITAASFAPIYTQLQQSLPSTILLHGVEGVGLATIATSLIPAGFEVHFVRPTLLTKTSSVERISIDAIQELRESVRSKLDKGRVIIIDDGDSMTEPAQNAFLKLLEEPNASTSFILTSHHPERLLPTVRSRVHKYYVPQVEAFALMAMVDMIKDPIKKRQTLFLASGRPAELQRLIESEEYFSDKANGMVRAKELVQSSRYESAVLIIRSKFSRKQALDLITQAITLLEQRPDRQSIQRLQKLLTAYDNVHLGGNVSLQLMRAML